RVDSSDCRLHVRVSGSQNTNDSRPQLTRLFQQLNTFFTWHTLVGHQQTEFVLVLLQEFEPVLGIGSGEDAKFIRESSREVLQGFLLVVDVEYRKLFVIV